VGGGYFICLRLFLSCMPHITYLFCEFTLSSYRVFQKNYYRFLSIFCVVFQTTTLKISKVAVVEKRPLAKSFSQPTNVPFRPRSSSVGLSKKPTPSLSTSATANAKEGVNKPITENIWSPNFIFLQLFYSSFGRGGCQEAPLLLEKTEVSSFL